MPTQAHALFERVCQEVEGIRTAAAQEASEGKADVARMMLRACIVLVIASLDTYMHERGVELLDAHAQKGNPEAAATASYLGATAGRVVGPSAKATIRYKLSYKTLASPRSIDQLLTAVGLVATDVWEEMAIAAGSRPDRLRNQIGLHYDRRNQIAHEGDWDHVALDFRPLEDANVADCLAHVRALVNAFDSVV